MYKYEITGPRSNNIIRGSHGELELSFSLRNFSFSKIIWDILKCDKINQNLGHE